MKKRNITVSYIIFYVLFFPDTYRIIIGLLVAWLMTPYVVGTRPMTQAGEFVVWIMVATIGYAISARLGDMISERIKNLVLPDRKRG